MIKHDICKALYALSDGAVSQRRQPICGHLIVALVGLVLLVINFVVVDDMSGALGMTLMVAGVVMFLYGTIIGIVRLMSNERVPYHTATKRYMRFSERYYNREQLADLSKAVASGDDDAIEAVTRGNIAAITLVECAASDRSIVAYAIYEYVDFDNRLIGEVKVVTKS